MDKLVGPTRCISAGMRAHATRPDEVRLLFDRLDEILGDPPLFTILGLNVPPVEFFA